MSLVVQWMTDDGERRAFLATHATSIRVSAEMPLRANLSALDNIAVIPQYQANLSYEAAADLAWSLLLRAGRSDMAFKRDPDLTHAERFVAKLLRAMIGRPGLVVIDRPAMQLPDIHYPPFLDTLLERFADTLNDCWIVDYRWNAPLYPNR